MRLALDGGQLDLDNCADESQWRSFPLAGKGEVTLAQDTLVCLSNRNQEGHLQMPMCMVHDLQVLPSLLIGHLE